MDDRRPETPIDGSLADECKRQAAKVLGLHLDLVRGDICLAHVNIAAFRDLVERAWRRSGESKLERTCYTCGDPADHVHGAFAYCDACCPPGDRPAEAPPIMVEMGGKPREITRICTFGDGHEEYHCIGCCSEEYNREREERARKDRPNEGQPVDWVRWSEHTYDALLEMPDVDFRNKAIEFLTLQFQHCADSVRGRERAPDDGSPLSLLDEAKLRIELGALRKVAEAAELLIKHVKRPPYDGNIAGLADADLCEAIDDWRRPSSPSSSLTKGDHGDG
jgi:hypothetical protein